MNNMPHSLALELKKAGFPQGEGNYYVGEELWDETMQSDYEVPNTPKRSTWVYAPSLEELIEACGEEFHHIMHENLLAKLDTWVAGAKRYGVQTTGSTPSEAVALLWLSLNKK